MSAATGTRNDLGHRPAKELSSPRYSLTKPSLLTNPFSTPTPVFDNDDFDNDDEVFAHYRSEIIRQSTGAFRGGAEPGGQPIAFGNDLTIQELRRVKLEKG